MWKKWHSGHLIAVEQMVTEKMVLPLHCVEESHQLYVRQNIFVPIQLVLSDIWTTKKIKSESNVNLIHPNLCKYTGCTKSEKGRQSDEIEAELYLKNCTPTLPTPSCSGPAIMPNFLWTCTTRKDKQLFFANFSCPAVQMQFAVPLFQFILSLILYHFTSQLSASFKWHFDALLEEGWFSEAWSKL